MNINIISFTELSVEEQMETRLWRNLESVTPYFKIKYISEEMHRSWIESMRCKNPKCIAYVIEYKGERVGVTYFHSIDYTNSKCDWGIYIHNKKFRGQGIGHFTLQLMIEKAQLELGMNEIYLDVLSSNDHAISLYEKHGFIRCNEHDYTSNNEIFYRYKKSLSPA